VVTDCDIMRVRGGMGRGYVMLGNRCIVRNPERSAGACGPEYKLSLKKELLITPLDFYHSGCGTKVSVS